MAKVSELKEMIVDLRVELLEEMLGNSNSNCPYRTFGNPDNVDLDCNAKSCVECKEEFFERYREEVRKEVRKL